MDLRQFTLLKHPYANLSTLCVSVSIINISSFNKLFTERLRKYFIELNPDNVKSCQVPKEAS